MANDDGLLAGGGEAGRLLRTLAWQQHPLGPPAGWPPALRALVGSVLAKALQAGFHQHIAKPVDPSRLLSVVASLRPGER